MLARGLLFDFDGVIADTENIHIAAWQRALEMMGCAIPEELCAEAMEMDDRVFLARFFAMREFAGGDIDGWVARKQTITRALLADSPRVYPGIPELIASARRRRFKIAVVTTTWRENVTTVLQASGLLKKIDVIVGKEDVAETKPHPEPYLRAIALLDLNPFSSVAFEDSPNGLISARRASLRTIAVGHRRPLGSWMGDSPYLTHFRDTEAVIALLAALK